MLKKTLSHLNSGQAIVLIALTAVGLIAVMGLSIDGGRVLLLQRRTQNATDAAVIAATRAMCRGDVNYVQAGLSAAAANGFDNNGTTNKVVVSVPPLSPSVPIKDECKGCYLEVVIKGQIPGTFIAMFYHAPLIASTKAIGVCRPNMAGNDPTDIGLRAMWGISDTCQNTVDFTGSAAYISGGIHTNNDLHYGATGGGGTVIGPVSYASGDWQEPPGSKVVFLTGEYEPPAPPDETAGGACETSCFKPPASDPNTTTDCEAGSFPEQDPFRVCDKKKDPMALNINDYAPGGAKALQAGSSYHAYTPATCTNTGFREWMDSNGFIVNNVVQNGLYYSACGIELSGTQKGKALSGTATFVSAQDIKVSGGVDLTWYMDELMFFANGGAPGACNYNAVQVSGSSNIWTGNIYSPYGQVVFSGSSNNNIAQGCIVAFSINFSGSDNRVICNPTDPEFIPSPAISLSE